MRGSVVFIDIEVGIEDHKIHDIGALGPNSASFHASSVRDLESFAAGKSTSAVIISFIMT